MIGGLFSYPHSIRSLNPKCCLWVGKIKALMFGWDSKVFWDIQMMKHGSLGFKDPQGTMFP